MPRSSSKNRLKKLLDQVPSHDEVISFLGELAAQDGHAFDRAAAIVGVTLLEHGLKLAITGSFVSINNNDLLRLFDGGGNNPLSSFANRILFAYAMGLIGPKARRDLERIRGIRNAFAHTAFEVHFGMKEIANPCFQFELIEIKDMTAKSAYIHVVAFISHQLRIKMADTVTIRTYGELLEIPNPSRRYLP